MTKAEIRKMSMYVGNIVLKREIAHGRTLVRAIEIADFDSIEKWDKLIETLEGWGATNPAAKKMADELSRRGYSLVGYAHFLSAWEAMEARRIELTGRKGA